MRNRPALAAVSFLLFAGLAACGDVTSPRNRVPRTGRYSYVATGPAVRGELRGTLTISYASADSVAGSWSVSTSGLSYQPAVQMGTWNITAYIVWARGTDGTVYAHRIGREGDYMVCTGLIPLGASFGCQLEYLGP